MLKNSSKRLKIHSKTAQHRDRTRFEILEFQEDKLESQSCKNKFMIGHEWFWMRMNKREIIQINANICLWSILKAVLTQQNSVMNKVDQQLEFYGPLKLGPW